ncbi:hypothetical protein MKQ70_16535 [Chitinophaga sedimenti]|uniref:hypothetical protein n=1 Tax=Chitinophaga sedimenti TaxID=2033606 RepID=UPI002004314C|nr:hypothetical protein [Chitinophaga sedimenti]MCK7556536.1 hypothetical protein [Chitinophaga sedimenti]
MSQEQTPEESLQETLKQFDLYMRVPGNAILAEKIKDFSKVQNLEDTRDSLIPAAKGHFESIVCMAIFEIIFDISFHIHYFRRLPYKVINFVKASIKQYDIAFRIHLRDLLLLIVIDGRRFQVKDDSFDFLVSQLKSMDLTYTTLDFPFGIGSFEYFTGNNSIQVNREYFESWYAVRGFLQTKEEQYKQYIIENYSPELIKVIAETLAVEVTFQPKKRKVLAEDFLDSDLLELKPNIGGIGINFNELISRFKSWRKK